ncbi:hypothetical protein BDZ89DRAFT_796728 [Hymenopellis radicata]|nr:hypothetical protein BDZ89DRAFT_796728 [Hymenopellis radicata]
MLLSSRDNVYRYTRSEFIVHCFYSTTTNYRTHRFAEMPDLSIPSNAFPINRQPGTRAVADIVLHKVVNASFWPEEVPPVREVQYPFLNLRAYDAGLRAERVFSPFHRANVYDIRTITWLLSIQFISPDNLTRRTAARSTSTRGVLKGGLHGTPTVNRA